MKEGFPTKCLYLSTRNALLNAVESGKVDDKIMADIGILSLKDYLLAPNILLVSQQSQLQYLFEYKPSLWKYYPSLMRKGFGWSSGNINLLQLLSLTKSYTFEVLGFSSKEVHEQYKLLLGTNSLTIAASNSLRDVVNNPFKSLTISDLTTSLNYF